MDKLREVVQSYGLSFDELVDLVADAMVAAGYSSKHASAVPASGTSKAILMDSVIGLGFLCAKIETALLESVQFSVSSPAGEGFLSVYAAAKRLVILFRYAQSDGSLRGRAAAELDGEIDTLEEAVMRPETPAVVVEVSESIVDTSLLFRDDLPKAIQDQVLELRNLLSS